MEAMTGEHSCSARLTSATWPSCSAPIVGTKPMMRLSARACRACSFIQAMVRIVSTERGTARELLAGRGGALAIEVHQIRGDRLRSELPQHRGHLAAMVGAVIYEMLH